MRKKLTLYPLRDLHPFPSLSTLRLSVSGVRTFEIQIYAGPNYGRGYDWNPYDWSGRLGVLFRTGVDLTLLGGRVDVQVDRWLWGSFEGPIETRLDVDRSYGGRYSACRSSLP